MVESQHESESTDDSLNNVTIEEGDEHTRQITGGPQESMLSVENPEADDHIYSVAPAEGQKPIYIMTDTNFVKRCVNLINTVLAVVGLLQKDLES